MKVRIVRQPSGTLDGLSLFKYQVGQVYDVPAPVGLYLVAERFATVEMRREEDRRTIRRDGDRRK